jgi:hypothetical protein
MTLPFDSQCEVRFKTTNPFGDRIAHHLFAFQVSELLMTAGHAINLSALQLLKKVAHKYR